MAGRQRAEIARRDLQPDEWQAVAAEHGKLPKAERSALARLLSARTGLSLPSVYRRLGGQFPWQKLGRKPVSTAEQRQRIAELLEQHLGRISPTDIWMELGAPAKPSLQTVRRQVRRWRYQQLASLQLPLPLGPDRPTSFASAKRKTRTTEDVARDALAVLMRVLGGKR